ncbi:hypothetical protein OSTOST_11414, partial [Ostertagia ostertagi]
MRMAVGYAVIVVITQIKMPYYEDCGTPGRKSGEDLTTAWKRCADDYDCSTKCVNAYINRYKGGCASTGEGWPVSDVSPSQWWTIWMQDLRHCWILERYQIVLWMLINPTTGKPHELRRKKSHSGGRSTQTIPNKTRTFVLDSNKVHSNR